MTIFTRMAIKTYTVGMADMKLSAEPDSQVMTHALGSCLGIAIFDPVACVGGMLHAMLPHSKIDAEKARRNPFMFIDLGVPLLFREAYRLGAQKERIALKVAGGAQIMDDDGRFKIGERNCAMLRKILWKNGVAIEAEDVGGCVSRTMSLNLETGQVTVRSNGEVRAL